MGPEKVDICDGRIVCPECGGGGGDRRACPRCLGAGTVPEVLMADGSILRSDPRRGLVVGHRGLGGEFVVDQFLRLGPAPAGPVPFERVDLGRN